MFNGNYAFDKSRNYMYSLIEIMKIMGIKRIMVQTIYKEARD
jgi:hypothetical protein